MLWERLCAVRPRVVRDRAVGSAWLSCVRPRLLPRSRHLQEKSPLSDRGAGDGWSRLLLALARANALMVGKWLPIDEVSS